MNESDMPTMIYKEKGVVHSPIKIFRVNDKTIIAVYKGSLSRFDILIRYRQKLKSEKWSRIRTPKHIHWTVDILVKMQAYKKLTREFIEFFIKLWHKTIPIKKEKERKALNMKRLINLSQDEVVRYEKLSKHGEYNVKFLILLAKLLMIQEKTNRPDAYMFRKLLESLKQGEDLFSILSRSTLRGR